MAMKQDLQKPNNNNDDNLMTFSGHLEVLRKMLLRLILMVFSIGLLVLFFKENTFNIILAPSSSDFITYRVIEEFLNNIGIKYTFDKFNIDLITTELSSQFITHISTSFYLAILLSSPYILLEIFRFVSPALYDNERKISWVIAISMYLLFVLGLLINYFVIFPFSFRFLGTYQVSAKVHSTITLDSYMDSFILLSWVLGLIFQLPIASYLLARKDLISADLLVLYRRHAFLAILIFAAIITPPDVMTLILVALPLYILFEISILIVKITDHSH